MLLSLDTCGSTGSIALGRIDRDARAVEILETAELPGRSYSAQLVLRIGEMLARQRASVREIEAIVVVRGPGSFTGIRVGLSAAKGLAEVTRIPLIALSRLAVLAHASRLPHVLAFADAGRGDLYAAEYRDGKTEGERLLHGPEISAAAGGPGVVICLAEKSAAGLKIPENPVLAQCEPVWVPMPDPVAALQLALPDFLAGRFADTETLDGNYLRRSDAELFSVATRRQEAP